MDNRYLLKQYVDTGLQIPEYQFNQLSNNDRNTYIRKRLIAVKNTNEPLDDYEVNLLDDAKMLEYCQIGLRFPEYQILKLSKSNLETYLEKRILINTKDNYSYYNILTIFEYKLLSDKNKDYFASTLNMDYCYNYMREINWELSDDDLVNRIIRLRNDDDLLNEIEYLLDYSNDIFTIAYKLIHRLGGKFTSSSIYHLIKVYDKWDINRIKIGKSILDTYKNGEQLNDDNSPFIKILYELDLDRTIEISKYLIDYNYSLNNGEKIRLGDDIFWAMFEYIGDNEDTISLALYIQKYVDLWANQQTYIDEIIDGKIT